MQKPTGNSWPQEILNDMLIEKSRFLLILKSLERWESPLTAKAPENRPGPQK